MKTPPLTLHLIPNSHLDPVWLWDACEGLAEAIITVRTVLDLMEANPELTYVRGESLIYEHVRRHDPRSWRRIRRLVRAGRWELVGGAVIQPDLNLPSTAALLRHFTFGQRFFRRHFGRATETGWSADCFGHPAGLPAILRVAGIGHYVFGRPFHGPWGRLFRWQGPGAAEVLAATWPTGWYGSDRDDLPRRLDALVAAADSVPVRQVLAPFGLGNHGGGPTRRHLADIAAWAAEHPEVRVRYSTFRGYFAAVKRELRARRIELPRYRGELNFCLRGVYASGARVKAAWHRAEAEVVRAEALATAASPVTGPLTGPGAEVWHAVLFNTFHDILTGTGTERALEEQIAQLGGARWRALELRHEALLRLADRVDTSVPPALSDHPTASAFLVWNPHPWRYRGPLELEVSLDYRPIPAYANRPHELPVELRDAHGRPVSFQDTETEHDFMSQLAWRRRLAFMADLPPLGWAVYTAGWVEGAERGTAPGAQISGDGIANERWTVGARPGESGIELTCDGRAWRLSLETAEDPWGPWGGLSEEPASLDLATVRAHWTVREVAVLERGPVRAALWVRLDAGPSRADLLLQLGAGRGALDGAIRLFFADERARVNLVVPGADEADFDAPGGPVRRGPAGEVPGGRWVRLRAGGAASLGFASDTISAFALRRGALHATLVRAGRYTLDVEDTPERVARHRPVIDEGVYATRFLLAPPDLNIARLADELVRPPLVQLVPPRSGSLPRQGSLGALAPGHVQLLALKPAEDGDGVVLHLQETAGRAAQPRWTSGDRVVRLPRLAASEIAVVRLPRRGPPRRVTLAE